MDILFEVIPLDQKLDFILQLGTLLCGVPDVLVIEVVLVFVRIWPASDRIGAAHKKLIGYGI